MAKAWHRLLMAAQGAGGRILGLRRGRVASQGLQTLLVALHLQSLHQLRVAGLGLAQLFFALFGLLPGQEPLLLQSLPKRFDQSYCVRLQQLAVFVAELLAVSPAASCQARCLAGLALVSVAVAG